MDQQSPDMLPAVELPAPPENKDQPQQVEADSVSNSEKTATKQVEQGISVSPQSIAAAQAMQAGGVSIASSVDLSQGDGQAALGSAATAHLMADDTDLIEKEWVEKAKEIVSRTKDDPYIQNKEMTKIKADYLKKRYNKDIKIVEE